MFHVVDGSPVKCIGTRLLARAAAVTQNVARPCKLRIRVERTAKQEHHLDVEPHGSPMVETVRAGPRYPKPNHLPDTSITEHFAVQRRKTLSCG